MVNVLDSIGCAIFNAKEILEREQNHDTKQALAKAFLQPRSMIGLFPKIGVPDRLLHCLTNWREHDEYSIA